MFFVIMVAEAYITSYFIQVIQNWTKIVGFKGSENDNSHLMYLVNLLNIVKGLHERILRPIWGDETKDKQGKPIRQIPIFPIKFT